MILFSPAGVADKLIFFSIWKSSMWFIIPQGAGVQQGPYLDTISMGFSTYCNLLDLSNPSPKPQQASDCLARKDLNRLIDQIMLSSIAPLCSKFCPTEKLWKFRAQRVVYSVSITESHFNCYLMFIQLPLKQSTESKPRKGLQISPIVSHLMLSIKFNVLWHLLLLPEYHSE